jgi:hypothetical protein
VPFGERRVGVVPGDAGFEPGLDQGVGLQMDDDANRAAGIAALGARDAASAPVRPFETVSGSHIRRHGLRRRRERVQTENPRHRRRFRAPRAPRPQHEGGNRREGMTVDLPQIDGPACAAAWAEHVKPRVPAITAARIVGDHSMSRRPCGSIARIARGRHRP